jgi:hypothetical protein
MVDWSTSVSTSRRQTLGRCGRLAAVGLLTAVMLVAPGAAFAALPAIHPSFRLTSSGYAPAVGVDDEGTAHIAWLQAGAFNTTEQLVYCRVRRGERGCDKTQSFSPPLPAPPGRALAGGEGPRVLVLGADHVVLLTHREGGVDFSAATGQVDPNCDSDGGGCVAEDHLTWAYQSFDDGNTFQAPKLIGVVPTKGGVIAFSPATPFTLEAAGSTPPNNVPISTQQMVIAGVSQGFESVSWSLGFQAALLDGSTTFDLADLAPSDSASGHSAIGVTPDNRPLVLGQDSHGAINSALWVDGNLNAFGQNGAFNWETGHLGTGSYPTLASGQAGLYLLWSPNGTGLGHDKFVVQKYTLNAGRGVNPLFGPPVTVGTGVDSDVGQAFVQDAEGTLYGTFATRVTGVNRTLERLVLFTSLDGTHWGSEPLATADSGQIATPSLAAAWDGGGFAVYADHQGGNGQITAVPFGTTLAHPEIDVRVNAMEMTQGVQTFELPSRDPANPLNSTVNYHGQPVPDTGTAPVTVKFAENHPSVIRVYANSRTALRGPLHALVPTMTLRAFRSGHEIYPSPILPDDTFAGTAPGSIPSALPVGPVASVPPGAQLNPQAAYTFTIPYSWEDGDVTFQADVNPAQFKPTIDQCGRCRQYNVLNLGPIHFTPEAIAEVQPVAEALVPAVQFPSGGLDPDLPYTPQVGGITSGKVPPFAGARAVTPFPIDVNPYFDIEDVTQIFKSTTNPPGATAVQQLANYKSRSSQLLGRVQNWAKSNENTTDRFPVGLAPSAAGYSGGLTSGGQLYSDNQVQSVFSDDRPLTATSHELNHGFGRVHAGNECGSGQDQTADAASPPGSGDNTDDQGQRGEQWPPNIGTTDGYFYGVGLDVTAPSPYRILSWDETNAPTDSSGATPSAIYDLMSYCGGGNDSVHWISVRNWNRDIDFSARAADVPNLAHAANAGATRLTPIASAAATRTLAVNAAYDPLTSQGAIISVQPDSGGPTPIQGGAIYSLRGLDASGHLLTQAGVIAQLDHVEHAPAQVGVAGRIAAAGVRTVQVLQGGRVIAQRTASAHAPTLRLTSPRRGSRIGGPHGAAVRLHASDADGDPLLVTVEYSSDGGRSWRAIFTGSNQTAITVPSRFMGHSTAARVRVHLNDGFNETVVTSPRFQALGAPPTVTIRSPLPHARVSAGGNLNVAVTAFDDHNHRLTNLTWRAGRFVVAHGAQTEADVLPAGHYRLTATARDRFGRTGVASVPITVMPSKPLLRVLGAPRSTSRNARSVTIRVAAIVPAILCIGRLSVLVGRTVQKVRVPIKPSRRAIRLTLKLRSGPFTVPLTLTIARR